MKTMTLNLTEAEMEALEKLADAKGMNKTAVMRQALRLYQTVDLRLTRGERVWFSGEGQKKGELVLV